MELTTDISLKGVSWSNVIDELGAIFKTRTHYSLFMLCLSIGIMYDKRIAKPYEENDESKTVPRNVLQNNDNGKLDFYFQAAILSTTTEEMSEEERLELAFGEKKGFNKIGFLLEFANYGVTELEKLIGSTPLESMDNIKNFLIASVEGRNLEIDDITDDILLEDF